MTLKNQITTVFSVLVFIKMSRASPYPNKAKYPTNNDNTMLYQMNGQRVYLRIKARKKWITISATTKLTAAPIMIGPHDTSPPSTISSSNFLAPIPRVMGIASKNEKRADSIRDNPSNIPPAKVDPERESPGISAKA